jgi:voltage-gated potassium channel
MEKLRRRTMQILDKGDHNDMPSLWCDRIITLIILLSVAAVILESVDYISKFYSNELQYFENFAIIFFSTEFLLRLWSSGSRYVGSDWKGRKEYIFSFYGLIDLISILPFYFQFLVPGLNLVILRMLRLTRLLKLSHYSTAIEDLVAAIYAERRSFSAVLYLLSIAIVASSSLLYYAEAEVQPEKLASIPHAIYWSIITLTTVGYGDVSPITTTGKIIAAVTAFLGVASLAIFSGIVASAFSNQLARKRAIYEQQLRDSLADGNIDEQETRLLENLQIDFGLSDEVVAEISRRVKSKK